MAQQTEQGVQLQSDQLAPAGLPIRTIVATVVVNGVPTQVAMQVVAIADGNGVILDDMSGANLLRAILVELSEIRRLQSMMAGVPFLEPQDVAIDASRTSG